ncbi:MAG TPA: MarR family transcriptional regulator [Acidimicrobiales bacterium]|jgi:DNA-binding MarR family transcriptional regulator|nr:MarR family transcriptional regulator [Acidimicrobiales bacterium]
MPRPLTEKQWRTLLSFRIALRAFLHWSEGQAASVGLTAAQHQLLVAVRGHRGKDDPTISDLAGYLYVRHHSAIGLLERAEALGLVQRYRDPEDQRLVRVVLTPLGHERVEALAAAHLEELKRLAPLLDALVAVSTE